MKRALICGVGGQDGSLLAKLLLSKGYAVYGTSRDAQVSRFGNLLQMGIRHNIEVVSMAVNDFRSVLQVISNVRPDEIYNLAGQSSVGLSFEQPIETLESIALGTLNILEAMRFTNPDARFYNAGSGECFGTSGTAACNEETPFRPRSPYAVAKAAAHWQTANYREAYSLYACTGILFNHESQFRPERFVTRKIVSTAVRIAAGSSEKLRLGNLNIARDWGWAEEYVDAMWRMLQTEVPDDFVIATGITSTLEQFVDAAFTQVGLAWRDHVEIDQALFRPTDLSGNAADPTKANMVLGWVAKTRMPEVVAKMIDAERVHMPCKDARHETRSAPR